MLTGGSAILLALTDLSLVRSIRGAIAPPLPQDLPGTSATYSPQPPPGLYPAPESRPLLEPLPTVKVDRYEPSDPTFTAVNPAAEPLLPTDPGAVRIQPSRTSRTYSVVTPAASDPPSPADTKPVVKIVLRRTDTYHRGAMIDFFC